MGGATRPLRGPEGGGREHLPRASELRGSGSIDATGVHRWRRPLRGWRRDASPHCRERGRLRTRRASRPGARGHRGPASSRGNRGAGTVTSSGPGRSWNVTVENGGRETMARRPPSSPAPRRSSRSRASCAGRRRRLHARAFHLLRSPGGPRALLAWAPRGRGDTPREREDIELVDATLRWDASSPRPALDRSSSRQSTASIDRRSMPRRACCAEHARPGGCPHRLEPRPLHLDLDVPDPSVERRTTRGDGLGHPPGRRRKPDRLAGRASWEATRAEASSRRSGGDDLFAAGGGGAEATPERRTSDSAERRRAPSGASRIPARRAAADRRRQVGPSSSSRQRRGAARIVSGTLILDGVIDASGADAENDGAPAFPRSARGPGSIHIATDVLRGSGTAIAAGGSARRAEEARRRRRRRPHRPHPRRPERVLRGAARSGRRGVAFSGPRKGRGGRGDHLHSQCLVGNRGSHRRGRGSCAARLPHATS